MRVASPMLVRVLGNFRSCGISRAGEARPASFSKQNGNRLFNGYIAAVVPEN
jgi:hypothetical protein